MKNIRISLFHRTSKTVVRIKSCFGRMSEVHLPCVPDVASTSPPMSTGAFSACGSTSTSLGDYEIEVVEIRVRDGELDDIIP
jgi:hypothetical protein